MTVTRTYYVYIMTNAWNTVFYVGMTGELPRRMAEHKTEQAEGFAKRYRAHKLVHVESFTDVREAIEREKRLKRWRRVWKEELIEEGESGLPRPVDRGHAPVLRLHVPCGIPPCHPGPRAGISKAE